MPVRGRFLVGDGVVARGDLMRRGGYVGRSPLKENIHVYKDTTNVSAI